MHKTDRPCPDGTVFSERKRERESSNMFILKLIKMLSTNWHLQNSRGDVKCNIGILVNNIVTTMCGAMWVLDLLGGVTS